MRRILAVTVAALLLIAPCALAGDEEAVARAKAEKAATAWLALTDGGKYAASWDEAAAMFKAAVSKPDWERMLGAARTPLGAVKARALKAAKFTRTLPGAPDGEYVVLQFESSFEKKASAVETVTPTLDKDGVWRVSGYFIR